MDLQLKNSLFLVGGASSGLGLATAIALLEEGAHVIGISRHPEPLLDAAADHADRLETVAADLTKPASMDHIMDVVGDRTITGAVINAGGPPAMSALDTQLSDWDQAYQSVVRWKIDLTQRLVKRMQSTGYGRLVFIESVSVKQPLVNLVLSNAMRLAVVGFVKTLSQEIATSGITLNIMGPGLHDTPRLHSLIKKNAELSGVSEAEMKSQFAQRAKVGSLGDPHDFATLALWLLSPHARYTTGQTFSVDGGFVLGTMG